MHIRQLAIVGIISLALTPTAFAAGVAQAVDGLEADVGALDSQVSALQAENAELQAVITSLTAIVTAQTAIVDSLVEQQRCHTRPGDLQADENGNYAGGVDWSGCDKTGLSMWGNWNMFGGSETDVLTNANLIGVDFTLANLIGIIAGGANLDGARFVNASLAYSNFEGANITSTTVFINTTCPDETNSDLNGGTCAGHMIY